MKEEEFLGRGSLVQRCCLPALILLLTKDYTNTDDFCFVSFSPEVPLGTKGWGQATYFLLTSKPLEKIGKGH